VLWGRGWGRGWVGGWGGVVVGGVMSCSPEFEPV